MFSISEENLKKLSNNIGVSREDWGNVVDEVIEDERRTREGMSMYEYAKREIELAKMFDQKEVEDGGFDYGGACYDSALKAFESLTQDGHSGMSVRLTKHILNRLIDGKPLTPIVDIPDAWNHIADTSGRKDYQSRRMSSLFKYIYADGIVRYSDINAYICVDINTGVTYHSGLVQKIMDEMYPIQMPYMPMDHPIAVYCEDFLTDTKNGDYDTVGVLYANIPGGDEVLINRYFKEDADGKWIDINQEEYHKRAKDAKN